MGEIAVQGAKTADRVNALLMHVRSGQDGNYDAAALARTFDVPEALVREILSQRAKPKKSRRPVKTPAAIKNPFIRAYEWLDSTLDKWLTRPTLFIIGTTLLMVVLVMLADRFIEMPRTGELRTPTLIRLGGLHYSFSLRRTLMLLIVLVGMVVQLVGVFRLRKSRYAALAGAILGTIFATSVLASNVTPPQTDSGVVFSDSQWKVLILIGCFGMGMLYAGFGSLIAVAGGWLHMSSEERRFRDMSRLEMLERYFEIEEALERAPAFGSETKRENPLVASVKRHGYAWVSGLSVINFVVSLGLMNYYHFNPLLKHSVPPGGYLAWSMMWSLVGMLSLAFILWQARSILHAVGVAVTYYVVAVVMYFVPVQGRELLTEAMKPWTVALAIVSYSATGAVIGLASKIARYAQRQAAVKRGDPSALVRELVRLEERLVVNTGRISVLAVDVAGSTAMKAGADPMDAEFSFAAYQAWVAEVCRRKGGRVHSTAGDGAIVSFGDARSAFESACILQLGLEWLNRERNRLEKPFRIRVGLHEGEVAADLDKLQFTRVIDVAAHVESVSPVGGVAATEELAGQLTDVPWVALPESMDGHRVFTVGSDALPRFGEELAVQNM